MDLGIHSSGKSQKKHDKKIGENKALLPSTCNPPPDSLIHPDWELLDPNPNIYDLFQIFDKRFFWSKLGSVEVKWSPRMTSCAGVCTYKGRGGCVVSLSAPLLKLRPRKDLIETLLHEMIHAYLFVTKNFKDRSDHGPEFHKHMYRINAEGGTKITVYHSFHDEVHHYQTHWWRCDGPCQQRRPYFGLVKRSMNRAPGPSDFWFAEHQMTCGGTFIKIKEPEGYKSKNKKQKVLKNEESTTKMKDSRADLTNYFPYSPNSSSKVVGINSNHRQLKNMSDKNIAANGGIKNVFGFHALPQPSKPVGVYQPPESSKLNGSDNRSGSVGIMSNKGGTLVERPKAYQSGESTVKKEPDKEASVSVSEPSHFTPFSGTGFKLGGAGKNNKAPSSWQQNVVSNGTAVKSGVRIKVEVNSSPITNIKIEDSESDDELTTDSIINCLVCNKSVRLEQIDNHLEKCKKLDNVFDSVVLVEDSDDETETTTNIDTVECPCCLVKVIESQINEHLDMCLH